MAERVGQVDARDVGVEDHQQLAQVLASLNAAEKALLELRFGNEWNQSQIAAHVGVSQIQISRRLQTLFARLRSTPGAAGLT